jgi:multidrug resistance protein MdtO
MSAREDQNGLRWFPEFLRHELAPYPGRWSLVARMVLSATLSMLVIVTFRIPYGAIGVNCAFILSRENLAATAKSGFYFILAFAAWAALTPIGARMFASDPLTHFLWEGVTVFLCFFLLKTLTNFPLAAGVVVVATGTLAIWYLPGPAELNVELTLWQILATAIGALITFLVEVVFRYRTPQNFLLQGLDDRLRVIEELLQALSDKNMVPDETVRLLTQYSVVGESALRQHIPRDHAPGQMLKLNALIALLGQSIELAAALASSRSELKPSLLEIAAHAEANIRKIRTALSTGQRSFKNRDVEKSPQASSLLSELAFKVNLMKSVLILGIDGQLELADCSTFSANTRLFIPDAFTNPEYIKYALAGTAASMICYIIYVGLNWPGISTAVTTCILTALSNIGSSRQKQLLRIVGAAIGGFVLGVGSQVFVLPYLDSIVGLTLLLAFATGVSAYVATSSPRLSYVGLQMAFAFYLINVTDFKISLDLTIGRDRVIGILLGIGAMWFVFERLYSRPAGIEMIAGFAQTARLMAELAQLHAKEDGEPIRERISHIRETVSGHFANISSEADAVLFENGPDRQSYLAAEERIRNWLSTLRTVYVLQLALAELPRETTTLESSERPQCFEESLQNAISESLNQIAECLEKQLTGGSCDRRHQALLDNLELHITSIQQDDLRSGITLVVKLILKLEHDILETSVYAPSLSAPLQETAGSL